MNNSLYKKRDGYWGILPIPQEYVLDLFAGRITINSPEDVRVHSIHNNVISLSLDIILYSDELIPNVTYECYEGVEIPQAIVSFRMNEDVILGKI
ncbi:hypothetical protein [Metabacillus fastidiosus]|uniref:hypothetical protein n=1 Tax=Metabacillus fastidiosus TaxID=1458 RepID=UPI003D280E9A